MSSRVLRRQLSSRKATCIKKQKRRISYSKLFILITRNTEAHVHAMLLTEIRNILRYKTMGFRKFFSHIVMVLCSYLHSQIFPCVPQNCHLCFYLIYIHIHYSYTLFPSVLPPPYASNLFLGPGTSYH